MVLLVLEGGLVGSLLQGMLAGLVGAFELLLLGEDVCEGALAAEDVATLAGHWVAGDLEAQAAGAKGEEGVAVEAGGGGVPVGLCEGSLVGGEDWARCVSLAWAAVVRMVLVVCDGRETSLDSTYCVTWSLPLTSRGLDKALDSLWP